MPAMLSFWFGDAAPFNPRTPPGTMLNAAEAMVVARRNWRRESLRKWFVALAGFELWRVFMTGLDANGCVSLRLLWPDAGIAPRRGKDRVWSGKPQPGAHSACL